jgi:tetratricopeptide (TPR) repeat protein
MGSIDESIEDFTRVLELDPDHINAAYARGACENRRGNFEKAIEDYQMALDKDREREQSPHRRPNNRDLLLSRELSAAKSSMIKSIEKPLNIDTNDFVTQNRPMNRTQLLLSPGAANMRISLEDPDDQEKVKYQPRYVENAQEIT